jgi:hypothetical protein
MQVALCQFRLMQRHVQTLQIVLLQLRFQTQIVLLQVRVQTVVLLQLRFQSQVVLLQLVVQRPWTLS